MTILNKIIELLALHGVDGRHYDRIDVALEKLYEVEKAERAAKPAPQQKKAKKEQVAPQEEEHLGI